MDEKPNEMQNSDLLEKAEKFREGVLSSIALGPEKRKITITFPENVCNDFTTFAKTNSADCYWLAIKQLLDFHREQTENDIKTMLIMQKINELQSELDELKTQKQPEPKKYKTFGQEEQK